MKSLKANYSLLFLTLCLPLSAAEPLCEPLHFVDDFNRSDGGLGSNWHHETGLYNSGSGLVISGNQLVAGDSSHQAALYAWTNNPSSFGELPLDGDQYSECKLVDATDNGWSGAFVRLTKGSHAYVAAMFSSSDVELYDVYTSFADQLFTASPSWSANDVLRVSVHGNSPPRIYISQNGNCIVEKLDFTHDYTGGYAGIGAYEASGHSTPHVDNWRGGNVVNPGPITDTFTRADGLLGVNYVCASISDYNPGSGGNTWTHGIRISGNKLVNTDDDFWQIALWSWELPLNHFAKVTLGNGGSGAAEGVAVRATFVSSGNSYYLVFPYTDHLYAYAFSSNAFHELDNTSGVSWSAGDVLRVEATGDASSSVRLIIKKNGIRVWTVVDSTYKLVGHYSGPALYNTHGTSPVASVDNFSTGTINK